MKLGHCTILGAVEGVPDADVYEVERDDTGQRLVARVTSRAVPPFSDAAGDSERFLAAATPFAALDHPNVLPLVDYGEQSGLRFLIEPYVGQTMLDYLTSGQPLPQPVSIVRRVVADTAAGLQYLHDRGLVHGHVNVRALYLQPTGNPAPAASAPDGGPAPFHVLVGDFGLRRFFEDGAADDTTFAEFIAPEQRFDDATPASDQYALAVLAHLLLTGRLPVISSRSQPIEDVSPGDLVPPSQLNPALPPAIDYLLNTALQPDPEQRFHRISDLATALDIATGAAPPPSVPIAAPRPATPPPAPSAPSAPSASVPLAPAMPPGMMPPGASFPPLPPFAHSATSAPVPVSTAQAAPPFAPPSAPLPGPPPVAPASGPVYLLPKAPPYTEPMRAVKPLPTTATAARPRGGKGFSRRTLLLAGAGGVAGVALLGGVGYYFFTRSSSPPADSIGFFRASRASFLLLSSLAARQLDILVPFGQHGDLPISGDWDGDGIDTPGVFRPSTATFYLAGDNSAAPRLAHTVTFGQPGDLPVAGDWTGSGRDSIGVFRPSLSRFLLKHTLDPGPADVVLQYGAQGDRPIAGDWAGSGRDGVGTYRPSDGTFYLLDSASKQATPVSNHHVRLGIGSAAGLPLAGDWLRAGHSGVGLFVPATRSLYLQQTLTGASAPDQHLTLGAPGDLPVAGHWR